MNFAPYSVLVFNVLYPSDRTHFSRWNRCLRCSFIPHVKFTHCHHVLHDYTFVSQESNWTFQSPSTLPSVIMRTAPNVIITGTPGVGKTVHCEQLAQDTGLRHLSINQVAKDRDCFETYDEELKTWIVDEDKVRWVYTLSPPWKSQLNRISLRLQVNFPSTYLVWSI